MRWRKTCRKMPSRYTCIGSAKNWNMATPPSSPCADSVTCSSSIMPINSLRIQLLAWLLVPLVLFVGFNTWVTYSNAVEMATVVHDRMLLGSARIIAEQIRYEDEALQVIIPPAALELFQSDSHDRVYYRVVAGNGTLLAGQPDLPDPPRARHNEESRYFN